MMLKFVLFCSFIASCLADSVRRPRGVSLSMISLYPTEGVFTCFDGSSSIPFDRINDDYCDCVYDGSDEPGTSACLNGSFYCNNVGHKPMFIPSSRVNDGICDCCDGSDEYTPDIKCENDCFELGQAAREEEARRLAMLKEGSKIRAELSLKGKQIKREKQLRLLELTKEQTEAEFLKSEKEKIKLKVEEQEKAALDVYKELEEKKRKQREEEERIKDKEDALQKFKEIDENGDGMIDVNEVTKFRLFDQDNDGVVSEDEVKAIFSDENNVSFDTFLSAGWEYMKQVSAVRKMKETVASDERPEEPADIEFEEKDEADSVGEEPFDEHDEDSEDRDDVESVEDADTAGNDSDAATVEIDKIEYDQETLKLIEEANNARAEYESSSRNLRDIQREIKQTEEALNKDYGKEDEFAYLVGECYEYTDGEYTYKLCPFDQVSQRPKDGGIETSLGTWGNWVDDKYEFMFYGKGQSCWNGPQRHTRVKLSCNLQTAVVAASEPSRCEYLLEFNTPAVCTLKELHGTVDQHDEL